MEFMSILLLTVVGLMAARDWFIARFAQLQGVLDAAQPAQALIGIAAMILGVLWFLITLKALFSVSFAPISVLLSLGGSALLTKLGFLFSAPLLNEQLFRKNEKMQGKVMRCQERCDRHREKMGIASVGLSLALLLLFLAGAGL